MLIPIFDVCIIYEKMRAACSIMEIEARNADPLDHMMCTI